MDDFGAFLARVIRQLRSEGTTTLGPRKALWSHEDPVTLFGAEASASGWEAIERIFNRLAQSFSDGQSCTYDVVGAGVSGDLGYVAAIERSVAGTHGSAVPPSWPPCATSPSACTAWPERPTSPPPHGVSADTPPAHSASSHNGSINNAGALGLSGAGMSSGGAFRTRVGHRPNADQGRRYEHHRMGVGLAAGAAAGHACHDAPRTGRGPQRYRHR
jgi:hypothetical protein